MNGTETVGEHQIAPSRRPRRFAARSRPGPRPAIRATRRPVAISPTGVVAAPVPGRSLSRPQSWPAILALGLSYWPLLATLAVYVAAAVAIVPIMVPVAISDDWTYARSVEILILENRLEVLPVAAATVVFQAFWGGAFAAVLGLSFGAMRVSTVVLHGISGLAIYGLCRELGQSRARAAFGAATYLFNPLGYAIAFSFMSDPHFAALLAIAVFWYVRGLQPHAPRPGAVVAGSAFAGLAFLVRPHGALIPLAVGGYLVLSGRLRPDRSGVSLALRVAAVPVVVAAAYYGWYALDSGSLPSQQGLFLGEARAAGWNEGSLLVRRLAIIAAMYLGLFVLPIAVAAVPRLGDMVRGVSVRGWLFFAGWQGLLLVGLGAFWAQGRRMPLIPHFLGRSGPGSGDLRAARPHLAGAWAWDALTVVCAAASLILALGFARRLRVGPRWANGVETVPGSPDRTRPAAGLTATIGLVMLAGVVPQSLLFRNWIISLDRYLLPLLPFAVCLGLWALRDIRLSLPLGWATATLIAAFAIAGTRDALVFQDRVWAFARYANEQGVDNTRLDAGYPWDAYHLWEYSQANNIPTKSYTGTWWTDVYAPATDSSYAVAGGPVDGYDAIAYLEYSAWLQQEPVYLYLLRRHDVPGPP
ncbi:MAG: hypothetical protein AVDCRST_MAG73-3585 [uncultured Thermomicrobiales bacterium]|uniref:Glycosyltransferase RgtA/B/C/D-like domain-containing protein n=1 Tax=uncultured Thermomicrobiales bacterium TaxID=1645740 RepID=A0A6J4UTC6_9BACT|nr:MAG: hypothetical protein AVDCRST_MAG73-3585 [uncultured Thermomicrobiales bacterium]